MTGASWLALVVACGAASAVGVEAVRRAALRHDVLDVPNARSSHARPVPRGGGLAVVLAVGAAWAAAAVLDPAVRSVGFPLSVLLVAAVSALDDVRTLGTAPRFVVQGGAVALLLASVGAWTTLAVPGAGTLAMGPAGTVLAVLWLVGLTNAYNFMDGIDGIAGAQGVVAGVAWAVLGAGLGVPVAALVGALVAAACAGFLVHNWPPARIFMGDVGAASLGFLFAALPLVSASADPLPVEVKGRLPLAGLLVVWPFVFDAVFTILRRAVRRENLLQAHRTHLYQRLVRAGWPHARTTALYALLATLSGTAGVGWGLGGSSAGTTAGVLVCGIAIPVGLVAVARRAEARSRAAP